MAGLQERLGEALFRAVAGPDGEAARARIHSTPGPRWFEPDSAIAEIHGDASMFVGALRALMLQSLHPAAMTAVVEHSGYRDDLWGRLARTSTFLATTTFAAADDAQQAVDVVRAIHKKVTGTLPDGTPYAASDPHLLEWVHVAEVDSFLHAHRVYGRRPLGPAGRNAYLRDAAVVARKLGVLDPPETELGLSARLEAFRAELRGIPAARDAVRYVRTESPLPLAAKPAYAVLHAAAIALLPEWAKRELGLPHRPGWERTGIRAAGTVATAGLRWMMAPTRRIAARLDAERDSV